MITPAVYGRPTEQWGRSGILFSPKRAIFDFRERAARGPKTSLSETGENKIPPLIALRPDQ